VLLTADELVELTKKARPTAQKRELDFLGIPARLRSDGSLVVLWEDVRATQGVKPARREPQLRIEP
jgi:Domain of unknown function (DUF4224)